MITEAQLHKGGIYVWRKHDYQHRTQLKVTQVTRYMVRALSLDGSASRPSMKGERFWNPKCIFLQECSTAGE